MTKFLPRKLTLIVPLALLVGGALYATYTYILPFVVSDPVGREILVDGRVIENNSSCITDESFCFLLIETSSKYEMYVIYGGPSRGNVCPNSAATAQGRQVKTGDEIEAFGRVINQAMTISTCDMPTWLKKHSDEYFIRVVR